MGGLPPFLFWGAGPSEFWPPQEDSYSVWPQFLIFVDIF